MWYLTKAHGIWNITRNPSNKVDIYGYFDTKEEALNFFYDEIA